MDTNLGRSLRDGLSPFGLSQQAVSPVPASIPSADHIPHGPYCYASIAPMDENGRMKISGMCPYWERRGEQNAYCAYLREEDDLMLWDQVKICGVNDEAEGGL